MGTMRTGRVRNCFEGWYATLSLLAGLGIANRGVYLLAAFQRFLCLHGLASSYYIKTSAIHTDVGEATNKRGT